MKVALCVPVYGDTVKTRFAEAALALAIYAAVTPFDGQRIEIERFFSMGLLPESRNNSALNAMEWGADWTLWIDSDMTFPPDTLHRLLAYNKPLVGINYLRRGGGGVTARQWRFGKLEQVETTAGKGLEQVAATGFGVVLISAAVLRALTTKTLPFEFGVNEFGGTVTEDYIFFDKARRAGFTAYIDHTLSMEVGHLAETELRFPR